MAGFGFWPVAVQPLGNVACGTILWRASGSLHVTVVVKACFELVLDGVMKPLPPDPVRPDGGELAPYLGLTDVVLQAGHAFAIPANPVTAVAVRLAVVREWPLLDKRVLVYGDDPRVAAGQRPTFVHLPIVAPAAGGAAAVLLDPNDPRQAASFAALSPVDPRRQGLLGGGQPPRAAAGVMDIPERFPWEYFQVAPTDQRIPYLHGDEWIVLDGLHPELPRVKSRLPGAYADVRVYPPTRQAAEGPTFQVAMQADRLNIDADAMRCSVLWRGSFPVADELSARALTLLSAVTVPGVPSMLPSAGEPIQTPLDVAGPSGAPPAEAPGPPPSESLAATHVIDDELTAESAPEPTFDDDGETRRILRAPEPPVGVIAAPPVPEEPLVTAAPPVQEERAESRPSVLRGGAAARELDDVGFQTHVREEPSAELAASDDEEDEAGFQTDVREDGSDEPVGSGDASGDDEPQPATERLGTGAPMPAKLRSPAPGRFERAPVAPVQAKKTIPYYSLSGAARTAAKADTDGKPARPVSTGEGAPAPAQPDLESDGSAQATVPDDAPGAVTLHREGPDDAEPKTEAFRRIVTDQETSGLRRVSAASRIVPSRAELPAYLPSEAKRWARAAEPSEPPPTSDDAVESETRPSQLELTSDGAVSVRFLSEEEFHTVDDFDSADTTAITAPSSSAIAAARRELNGATASGGSGDAAVSSPFSLRAATSDPPPSDPSLSSWDEAKSFASTSHILRPQAIPGAPWVAGSGADREDRTGRYRSPVRRSPGSPPVAGPARPAGPTGPASGEASMRPSDLPVVSVQELEGALTETLSVRDVELIDEGDGDRGGSDSKE